MSKIIDEYVFLDMESELEAPGRQVLVDNIDLMPIHVKCRLKRAYEGLSISNLAEIIGCNPKHIREFESGKKCLPLKFHKAMEKYIFQTKYRLDDDGMPEFYDYDWHN
ncbi:helix-turn-helix transcriptional regulator [Bacillus halotolerans]|uniref:helix-turn-helix domain-containing protein n=1 Tax=Bacillus halotolerans TaxID=260554 RepID=UPI001C0E9499|nr:helix-turn-helix transcriptional regulator [Bacillus halotolerans]MBU5248166.1 helix-turn-helix transcriptional regulator [Bacillus halotolerans]